MQSGELELDRFEGSDIEVLVPEFIPPNLSM